MRLKKLLSAKARTYAGRIPEVQGLMADLDASRLYGDDDKELAERMDTVVATVRSWRRGLHGPTSGNLTRLTRLTMESKLASLGEKTQPSLPFEEEEEFVLKDVPEEGSEGSSEGGPIESDFSMGTQAAWQNLLTEVLKDFLNAPADALPRVQKEALRAFGFLKNL